MRDADDVPGQGFEGLAQGTPGLPETRAGATVP